MKLSRSLLILAVTAGFTAPALADTVRTTTTPDGHIIQQFTADSPHNTAAKQITQALNGDDGALPVRMQQNKQAVESAWGHAKQAPEMFNGDDSKSTMGVAHRTARRMGQMRWGHPVAAANGASTGYNN